MIEFAIVLAGLYVTGALVWAMIWSIEWSVDKEWDPPNGRRAAAMFLGTPMWPFLGVGLLLRMIDRMRQSVSEMKDDVRSGDGR